MTRRYEGFAYPSFLQILDTFTGDDRKVPIDGIPLQKTTEDFASQPIIKPSPTVEEQPIAPVADITDPFAQEVSLTYPYPVARAWTAMKESDPRLQCKLLVDTFTAVNACLQVASEYLQAEDVRCPRVNQTLARDLRRPLISAWNLVLQRTLPTLQDANVSLFAPEVEIAYRKLETKCQKRFLVTSHYVDANGDTQTRTKKLGKIQALISYRNSLAHGFNQSQGRAQRELDTYLPLLREILMETRFLTRYEFDVHKKGN